MSHKGKTTTRDGYIKGDEGRKGMGAGGLRASGRSDSPRVLSRPVVGTSGVLYKIVLPWD